MSLEDIKNEIALTGGYDSFLESLKDNSLNRSEVIALALDSVVNKVAKSYAEKCISATVKKITDENAYHCNTSEDGVVYCVEVCDILDSDNFILL